MSLPLRLGDKGTEVADVCLRLKKWVETNPDFEALPEGLDLPAGDEFTPAVEAYVKSFQYSRNLPDDGVVDVETWDALVESNFVLGERLLWLSNPPMSGDDVLDLQCRLNQLGFDAGREDGLFSASLDRAVRSFQEQVGLQSDGVIGKGTLKTLVTLRRDHMSIGESAKIRDANQFSKDAKLGLSGMTIFIDPASARENKNSYPEFSDITYSIGKKLAAKLAASGVHAVMSRGPQSDPSNQQRAELANNIEAKLAISISLAINEDNPHENSANAYYFASPAHNSAYTSKVGQDLAYDAIGAIRKIFPTLQTKVAPRTWTILRATRMPAVIIEPGFISHGEHLQALLDTTVQSDLAHRLYDTVCNLINTYSSK